MYGSAIWRSEAGPEVEITFIEDGNLPYLFEDREGVEVTEFIREGRTPSDIPRTRSYSGLPKPIDVPNPHHAPEMSHHFKRPSSGPTLESRHRPASDTYELPATLEEIEACAHQVKSQAELDILLEGTDPATRSAMLEMLAPHLEFVPREFIAGDCPVCGMRRGSAIAHECLVAN